MRDFPAQKTAEVVRWPGIRIEGISVRFAGPGTELAAGRDAPPLGKVELGSLEWSDEEEEVPNEFNTSDMLHPGMGRPTENVCALLAMQTLQSQHQHNPNLVKQYSELAVSFKAWRPIRGDGNCYYRAVLYAWLERSMALGNLESLQRFDAMLKPHRRNAEYAASIRTCHRILRRWVAKRAACTSEADIRALLQEVEQEFNRERSDRAFIFCLRHLISQYLKQHARDPVHGSVAGEVGPVLTYEDWATGCGAKSIDDYCAKYVLRMDEEAADHVQHVCPKVLKTVVRICMVDRTSAGVNFIDCYEGATTPNAVPVASAAQLASIQSHQGQQPEIYLLFKPGHYDLLVPREDKAARFLEPQASAAAGPRGSDPHQASLLRLAQELCLDFSVVLRCVEDKLVQELEGKQNRLGRLDESLFEGQLRSVLDPLRDALRRFQECTQEGSRGGSLVAPQGLLGSLSSLLRESSIVGGRSVNIPPAKAGANPFGPRVAQAGRAPALQPPAVAAGRAAQAVQQSSRQPALMAPLRVPVVERSECCICFDGGATAVAPCGCAYHTRCLAEYAQLEKMPLEQIVCHLHEKPFGSAFAGLALPSNAPSLGQATPLQSPPARSPEVQRSAHQQRGSSTPLALKPPLAADDFRTMRGPTMDRLLEDAPAMDLGVGNPFGYLSPGPISPTSAAVLRRTPTSGQRVPQSGNLGAALGVPCVICFGEDGVLKTLHCNYKVHVSCLKKFWSERVMTLCRLHDIRCPAEVAGCSLNLEDKDLRGVIDDTDLAAAQSKVSDVDERNQKLIEDLRKESEEHRAMYHCAICLVEHEVEGCCTLPCQHRFCFESLQYHFDIIVRERRLNKLTCPAECCGFNLRSAESIHIFRGVLSDDTYHKLHEFLTRDNPHIHECKHLGCEEKVFLDDGDDPTDLECQHGHRFCCHCQDGPHAGMSCDERSDELAREKKDEEDEKESGEAWASALAMGWKPCPMKCSFGGGCKNSEECDHVTCECGFEFCWDCGVQRQVLLEHDNRWHKPSCQYHTPLAEVSESPVHRPNCPECQKMPSGSAGTIAGLLGQGVPCCFPADDGYPLSYIKRRSRHKPSLA